MRRLLLVAAALALLVSAQAAHSALQAQSAPAAPTVVFMTVKGDIEIELFTADAPQTTARILELAKKGFYRGTRFHWVQAGVVQFGDQLSRDMTKVDNWGKGGSGRNQSSRPIGVAETGKRQFVRGVVGLAHQSWEKAEDGDCQLFILKAASPALNGKYNVVGRVSKGMDVVDKLEVKDMIKDVAVK
jgi:peptidylprolyl isomerase